MIYRRRIFHQADPQDPLLLKDHTDNFYFSSSTEPDQEFPLGSLAEGYKSVLSWLFDMLVRIHELGGNLYRAKQISGVVLIDEIDLHLHPYWQRTILPSLERTFPKIQFIITSHSMLVAQSVGNPNISKLIMDKKTQQIRVDTEIQEMRSELSYDGIGKEIFDLQYPFRVETEEQLKKFYEFKEKLLEKKPVDEADFKHFL